MVYSFVLFLIFYTIYFDQFFNGRPTKQILNNGRLFCLELSGESSTNPGEREVDFKKKEKKSQQSKPNRQAKERQTLTRALFQAVHKTFQTQFTYGRKPSKVESMSSSKACQF